MEKLEAEDVVEKVSEGKVKTGKHKDRIGKVDADKYVKRII